MKFLNNNFLATGIKVQPLAIPVTVFLNANVLSPLGTQVTLANPVCLVGYIWASWKFFEERIHDEEMTLIQFFGDEYIEYQKNVPASGVPFVKGFNVLTALAEKDR